MTISEIEEKLQKILVRLSELPVGTLHVKKVRNKKYYYNRFYDNGVRKERYIRLEDVPKFLKDMKQKKSLTTKYGNLKNQLKTLT